jgi:prepilin-type N-terminal cleavage/methylation domain-containing protein
MSHAFTRCWPGLFGDARGRFRPHRFAMRRGMSLVELTIVLSLIGSALLLTLPTIRGWGDRLAVRRASLEIAGFYQTARWAAVYRSSRVLVEFGPESLQAAYEGTEDSLFLARPGPARHGVSMTVTRPEIRVRPSGLGWGAANTKLVLRRGAAAESLTTSRLGRLRRWP